MPNILMQDIDIVDLFQGVMNKDAGQIQKLKEVASYIRNSIEKKSSETERGAEYFAEEVSKIVEENVKEALVTLNPKKATELYDFLDGLEFFNEQSNQGLLEKEYFKASCSDDNTDLMTVMMLRATLEHIKAAYMLVLQHKFSITKLPEEFDEIEVQGGDHWDEKDLECIRKKLTAYANNLINERNKFFPAIPSFANERESYNRKINAIREIKNQPTLEDLKKSFEKNKAILKEHRDTLGKIAAFFGECFNRIASLVTGRKVSALSIFQSQGEKVANKVEEQLSTPSAPLDEEEEQKHTKKRSF